MSSAIRHVIAFLTNPLVGVANPPAIAAAQLILNASLPTPSAVYTFTSTSSPPPALLAASIGSAIPWNVWFHALGGAPGQDVLIFYGPGYLKVRVGEAPVSDVWSEETQGSVVPISNVIVNSTVTATAARLRTTLLSARIRRMRRTQQQHGDAETIRVPRLFSDVDGPASDSESDSDADSEHSSSYTSTESLTSASDSSPPMSPATKLASITFSKPAAPQLLYRAPRPKTSTSIVGDRTKKQLFAAPQPQPQLYRAPRPTPKITSKPAPVADCSKKQLTSYLYQGGVTRVMTGGVLLGPARSAVVTSKRS